MKAESFAPLVVKVVLPPKLLSMPKQEKYSGAQRFTDPAQYSSPIVINHGGKRQYVQLVMKKLVGVDAENGSLIWSSDWPGKVAVIPTLNTQ